MEACEGDWSDLHQWIVGKVDEEDDGFSSQSQGFAHAYCPLSAAAAAPLPGELSFAVLLFNLLQTKASVTIVKDVVAVMED